MQGPRWSQGPWAAGRKAVGAVSALTAVAGLQPPCSWRRLPPSMGLCYCLISKHTSRTRHEPQPLKAREQVREGSLKELSGANKNSQRIYITTGSSRRRLISPLRACAVRCAMLAAAEPSAVAAIGDLAAGPHEQAPAPRLPIPLPPRRHIAPRVQINPAVLHETLATCCSIA